MCGVDVHFLRAQTETKSSTTRPQQQPTKLTETREARAQTHSKPPKRMSPHLSSAQLKDEHQQQQALLISARKTVMKKKKMRKKMKKMTKIWMHPQGGESPSLFCC